LKQWFVIIGRRFLQEIAGNIIDSRLEKREIVGKFKILEEGGRSRRVLLRHFEKKSSSRG
jgi:hypothetical protein